jgi:porin
MSDSSRLLSGVASAFLLAMPMRTRVCWPFLALALVLGWAGPSRADEPAPGHRNADRPFHQDWKTPPHWAGLDGSHSGWLERLWTRDTLTGNWGGLRKDLHDRGIDLHLRLSQYGQGVTSGGVDTNGEYGGTLDYRLNMDLKKLIHSWDGLSINLHARTRWGKDILADAGGLTIPNTALLMPLPGDYEGTEVTGLTVNQLFPAYAGRQGLFTIGKLDIIDAVTLFFPSVAYGQEGFWNVNALVTALPWFGAVAGLSLYGGWLAAINQEYQTGETAVLVTGTENVTTSWNVSDSFDDGVWVAAFHRFLYKLGDKPGYFMIFGGVSTKDQASNDPHDVVLIPGQGIVDTDEENPWDIALYLSQVLWQAEDDPSRKATILIGGTVGPDNPQFAQYNFFTALEAYGPMPSRPHDRMGVSFWYSWLSDNFKDLVSPVADLRDTYGFELYYNIAINKWLHLTPDLQIVQNERERDDIAIIPGVRLVIDF